MQLVNQVDDLAKVVTRGDLVAQFAENLTNLIFQRKRTACRLLELAQGGKQLLVNKLHKVGACHAVDVIGLAVRQFRRCPCTPTVEPRQDGFVVFARHDGVHLLFLLEVVEIFQEEQPRCLLNVIQFSAASCLVAQDVVYRIKCCFVCHVIL